MRREKEKTSACAVSGAFENPRLTGVPQARVLDPTQWWACKPRNAILAPSGNSIGSAKATPITNTAEV